MQPTNPEGRMYGLSETKLREAYEYYLDNGYDLTDSFESWLQVMLNEGTFIQVDGEIYWNEIDE